MPIKNCSLPASLARNDKNLTDNHAEIAKKVKLGIVIVGSRVEMPRKIRLTERTSTIKLTSWPRDNVIALLAPSIATPEMYCGDLFNCHLGEVLETLTI